MRPSVAGASRLMVLSSVDLPAPERPITPINPPLATEKEAPSSAAFVPKRHVKPSTTNMYCSRRPAEATAIARTQQFCDTRVSVQDDPHADLLSSTCHCFVTKRGEDHGRPV